jgi:hypothetical protein
LTFGQRIPFPPIAASGQIGDLPAMLRGANIGKNVDAAPWQAPTNKGVVGWQNFALPRALFDDLEIPAFLRRAREQRQH